MIVLDASVVVDLLAQGADGRRVLARLATEAVPWHAPQVLDLEVLHAVRRALRRGVLDEVRALQMIDDLEQLHLLRHDHLPLVQDIWNLRANLTAYDAAYVALAQRLDATLLTRDARMARAPRLPVRVELV